jgi:hypothetical protein
MALLLLDRAESRIETLAHAATHRPTVGGGAVPDDA